MFIPWNNFKHPYAQIYAPVIHIRLFCKTATKARTLGHSEFEETQFIGNCITTYYWKAEIENGTNMLTIEQVLSKYFEPIEWLKSD